MTSRLPSWTHRLLLMAGVFAAAFLTSCKTIAPPLKEGVVRKDYPIFLTGLVMGVDFYFPPHKKEAPVVVVAHGLSRSKRYMAGWGGEMAANGFIGVVVDQPTHFDYERNATAILQLLNMIYDGTVPMLVKPSHDVALVGFSMGGLTTLLAASDAPVSAWVGLDPVDMDGSGIKAAPRLDMPTAILQTEPSLWNFAGGSRKLMAAIPNPVFALKVRHSTHLNVEHPTDLLGKYPFRKATPTYHEVFEKYTIAFLRTKLLNDPEAEKVLNAAGSDPAVVMQPQSQRLRRVVSSPYPR